MFDKLIEYFLKFPGIGPRQAKRFVYFLADEDEDFAKSLSRLILEIKEKIKQCNSCYRFTTKTDFVATKSVFVCDICSGPNRDNSLLMVVEKDVDLENIEKSGVYNGKYFVLGKLIPLSSASTSDVDARLRRLFEKVKKEKSKEVILAMSATVEGENTSRYIEKILEPLKTKITRLGRGLSTGTELEFIDSETMANALKNRI